MVVSVSSETSALVEVYLMTFKKNQIHPVRSFFENFLGGEYHI